MAHIRKHPVTGKPQVRWRDPSGRERSKTFLRSTDARAFAAEIEHEISRGTLFDRSLSKTPICVAAAAWLEGRVALRRSSWVRDESYLRRHVLTECLSATCSCLRAIATTAGPAESSAPPSRMT